MGEDGFTEGDSFDGDYDIIDVLGGDSDNSDTGEIDGHEDISNISGERAVIILLNGSTSSDAEAFGADFYFD